MSIRQAIYAELIALDEFMATVPSGVAAVVGGDEDVAFPPPNVEPPVFYLEVLETVPSFSGNPNYLDGSFRLWGYDEAHAGFTRLRRSLLAAGHSLIERDPVTGDDMGDRFVDEETGEVVFFVTPRGLGPEIPNVLGMSNMRAQYYTWQTRHTMRGEWP